MEDLETLRFELESLLYTKSEAELKEFTVSIKLDVDLSAKSKIAVLKIIQRSIDVRVDKEGELSEKVSWFKHAIDSLQPEQQKKNESQLALNLLQQQIDALKQKQQSEIDGLLAKLAEARTHAEQTMTKFTSVTEKPSQASDVAD